MFITNYIDKNTEGIIEKDGYYELDKSVYSKDKKILHIFCINVNRRK